jgi:hypothetical protein
MTPYQKAQRNRVIEVANAIRAKHGLPQWEPNNAKGTESMRPSQDVGFAERVSKRLRSVWGAVCGSQ